MQARAQESRGFTADSRAADALGGDTRSRRAVGLRASAPRLAVPSCFKPRVQSASARSSLASGGCDLPRSLPTREEAATLPQARSLNTPSEEGEVHIPLVRTQPPGPSLDGLPRVITALRQSARGAAGEPRKSEDKLRRCVCRLMAGLGGPRRRRRRREALGYARVRRRAGSEERATPTMRLS